MSTTSKLVQTSLAAVAAVALFGGPSTAPQADSVPAAAPLQAQVR
jgi:hypothetical protein